MGLKRSCLTAALLAAAAPAWAHPGLQPHVHGGFAAGLLHPLTGLDHVLAMVGVGLFAALLGGRARWMVPAAFVTMMVAAGALGLAGIGLPGVEVGLTASVIALGAVIMAGQQWSLAGAMALVAAFAVFHGHAHGAEIPFGADALSYSIGFAAATALLHAAGLLFGHAAFGRRAVIRLAGGALAAAGIVMALV